MIAEKGVATVEDVRRAGPRWCASRPRFQAREATLKRFLSEKVYRSEPVMRPVRLAEALVADLFEAFLDDPSRMPDDWGECLDRHDGCRRPTRRRLYCRHDRPLRRSAEHQRLFDATPDLG